MRNAGQGLPQRLRDSNPRCLQLLFFQFGSGVKFYRMFGGLSFCDLSGVLHLSRRVRWGWLPVYARGAGCGERDPTVVAGIRAGSSRSVGRKPGYDIATGNTVGQGDLKRLPHLNVKSVNKTKETTTHRTVPPTGQNAKISRRDMIITGQNKKGTCFPLHLLALKVHQTPRGRNEHQAGGLRSP